MATNNPSSNRTGSHPKHPSSDGPRRARIRDSRQAPATPAREPMSEGRDTIPSLTDTAFGDAAGTFAGTRCVARSPRPVRPSRATSAPPAPRAPSARNLRSARSSKEHAVLTEASTSATNLVPAPATGSSAARTETMPERIDRFSNDVVPLMGKLFGYARNKTRDHALAEDLVQQTYERAWRHFDRFEPGSNMSAWLFTILNHVIANHYRAAASRPQTTVVDDLEVWHDVQAKAGASAAFSAAETRALELMPDQAVVAALEELPDQFRVPVYLADVEGFSYKEIAEMLEIPIGTVMSRLHRGRARLRDLLLDVAIERGYYRPDTQEAGA